MSTIEWNPCSECAKVDDLEATAETDGSWSIGGEVAGVRVFAYGAAADFEGAKAAAQRFITTLTRLGEQL